MDDKELREAQRRLEEKRAASSRPIPPIPIGLGLDVKVGDILGNCTECGKPAAASDTDCLFLNRDTYSYRPVPRNLKCAECIAKEQAAWRAEEAERNKAADMRYRKERCERMKQNSGIGAKFLDITWDDYKPSSKEAAAIKSVCREYADTFNRKSSDLVMIGACGTGKNMLASLIGLQVMEQDFRYLYTTAMRLVRTVKDSWRDRDQSEQAVIDSFTAPQLLCIDEIGVQFGSPTEQLYITEVINNRYEGNLPTILISNLTMKQIEDVLGVRAVDRFHERGKFLVFNWESYRRRKC